MFAPIRFPQWRAASVRDDGGQRLQVERLYPVTQHETPILRHHQSNLRIALGAQIVPNPSRCHLLQLAGHVQPDDAGDLRHLLTRPMAIYPRPMKC